MSKDDADKKAIQLLETVGLLDKKDAMPEMLSEVKKQRVAIAPGLAMNPDVMLLTSQPQHLTLKWLVMF